MSLVKAAPMHPLPPKPRDRLHSEEFLQSLMRRQLRLSVVCAAAFLLVLLALPLLNHLAPDWMSRRILGFTLTWFVLGVGFFPAVWIIAFLFIRKSIALEEGEVREITGIEAPSPRQP
jgi:uncharacterized membrane protein (DUF485 family)